MSEVKMAKNFGVWVHVKQEDLVDINPASDLFKRATEGLADRYSEDGKQAVNYAMECLHKDSDFEVDHDAAVSFADDGTYVMGWSWVGNDDIEAHDKSKKAWTESTYR